MKHRITPVISACLALSMTSTLAFADDCSNLDSDPAWVTGLKNLEQAIQEDNDKMALIYGEALLEICPRLPKLNYMMAQLNQKLGEEAKALYFLQSATRYTKEFIVDTEVLEQMWTERIFAEHPESSPENVKKLKTELNSAKSELQKTQSDLESSRVTIQDLEKSLENTQNDAGTAHETIHLTTEKSHKDWSILMWTGVGIASAGIIMTITGTALVATNKEPLSFETGNHKRARIEGKYIASWTTIGIGAATTVAGAIITGFAGYHYTRDNEVSFAIAPTGFSLSGTF